MARQTDQWIDECIEPADDLDIRDWVQQRRSLRQTRAKIMSIKTRLIELRHHVSAGRALVGLHQLLRQVTNTVHHVDARVHQSDLQQTALALCRVRRCCVCVYVNTHGSHTQHTASIQVKSDLASDAIQDSAETASGDHDDAQDSEELEMQRIRDAIALRISQKLDAKPSASATLLSSSTSSSARRSAPAVSLSSFAARNKDKDERKR